MPGNTFYTGIVTVFVGLATVLFFDLNHRAIKLAATADFFTEAFIITAKIIRRCEIRWTLGRTPRLLKINAINAFFFNSLVNKSPKELKELYMVIGTTTTMFVQLLGFCIIGWGIFSMAQGLP